MDVNKNTVGSKKVWRKFSSENSQGNVYKFKIEDHTVEDYSTTAKLLKNYFVKEEIIHVATTGSTFFFHYTFMHKKGNKYLNCI